MWLMRLAPRPYPLPQQARLPVNSFESTGGLGAATELAASPHDAVVPVATSSPVPARRELRRRAQAPARRRAAPRRLNDRTERLVLVLCSRLPFLSQLRAASKPPPSPLGPLPPALDGPPAYRTLAESRRLNSLEYNPHRSAPLLDFQAARCNLDSRWQPFGRGLRLR